MPIARNLIAALFFLGLTLQGACARELTVEPDLVVPPGFSIEVLTDQVPNARSMTLGERGTLFVSTRKLGKVYALTDL
ncbi:MAG: hypothetical protein PVG76_06880, partial [Chromatiales bacterium]